MYNSPLVAANVCCFNVYAVFEKSKEKSLIMHIYNHICLYFYAFAVAFETENLYNYNNEIVCGGGRFEIELLNARDLQHFIS